MTAPHVHRDAWRCPHFPTHTCPACHTHPKEES